ncbi:MAG: hypothetical protein ACK4F7_02985 [Inhella sp.]
MQLLLVYGVSLSWGIVPPTRARLGFAQRWPGVLEDCPIGRRTVFDDPDKDATVSPACSSASRRSRRWPA